ncbi:hypothetical protein SALBM217S_01736 [Streptomyces griseoloalbus]
MRADQFPGLRGAAVVRAEDGPTGVVTGRRPDPRLVTAAQAEQRRGHGQIDGAGFLVPLRRGGSAVRHLDRLQFGERLRMAGLAVETAGQVEPQDQDEPLRQARTFASASRASASASAWRPSALRANTRPLRAASATVRASGSRLPAAADATAAHSASHSACRPSEVSAWARSERAFSVRSRPPP